MDVCENIVFIDKPILRAVDVLQYDVDNMRMYCVEDIDKFPAFSDVNTGLKLESDNFKVKGMVKFVESDLHNYVILIFYTEVKEGDEWRIREMREVAIPLLK